MANFTDTKINGSLECEMLNPQGNIKKIMNEVYPVNSINAFKHEYQANVFKETMKKYNQRWDSIANTDGAVLLTTNESVTQESYVDGEVQAHSHSLAGHSHSIASHSHTVNDHYHQVISSYSTIKVEDGWANGWFTARLKGFNSSGSQGYYGGSSSTNSGSHGTYSANAYTANSTPISSFAGTKYTGYTTPTISSDSTTNGTKNIAAHQAAVILIRKE